MRNRFDEQLFELNREIIEMGAMCEEAIAAAAKALSTGDIALAENVRSNSGAIDQMERDIEGRCMKLLLHQQPVARDLRLISAALKMITDMERIGDQAEDIAEIVTFLNGRTMEGMELIEEMARETIEMVTGSVDAFVKKDVELAQKVINTDDIVDDYFSRVKCGIITLIAENHADGEFALEVLKYINKKVNQFKEEDGNLYAIYGTPAESLCGLQVEQFRKQYGIVEGVSDRPYVSNSFHCHVTEDLTPIEKQDLEGRFWELCNGGKIQYVRYPVGYNKQAIRALVRRAMKLGYYEGVNLSLAYCDDCGHKELEMDVCPVCGSKNLTKIDRMNGYLSYSRVHGDTRLNDAKMAEIAERKSM